MLVHLSYICWQYQPFWIANSFLTEPLLERLLMKSALSFDSCHRIFADVLGIKRGAAKIVSKLLNSKQNQRCMAIGSGDVDDV